MPPLHGLSKVWGWHQTPKPSPRSALSHRSVMLTVNFLISESFPPRSGLLYTGCSLKRGRPRNGLGYHFPPLSHDPLCKVSHVAGDHHFPPRTGQEDTISFGVQELARESFPLWTICQVGPCPHTPSLSMDRCWASPLLARDDQSGPRVTIPFQKLSLVYDFFYL